MDRGGHARAEQRLLPAPRLDVQHARVPLPRHRPGLYWDEVLEHAFAANQKALNAIPTPFVAPIMFVLDLVCSAGLLLFALANAKVIATLVAVVAVARARRVAKA